VKYNNQLVGEMVHLCPPFSMEKNEELLPLVAVRNPSAKQQMIEGNMSFVLNRVESYIRRSPEIEYLRDDMTSVGLVGVCKAVNKIASGTKVTYATGLLSYWINREIMRLLHTERKHCKRDEDPARPDPTVEQITRKDVEPNLVDLRDLIYSCCKTEQERSLIRLREETGLDCQEIGPLLGVSQPTAYRILNRIYRRFERKHRNENRRHLP
jgi:RNA polymerase sigma factor (sigma-70 family)